MNEELWCLFSFRNYLWPVCDGVSILQSSMWIKSEWQFQLGLLMKMLWCYRKRLLRQHSLLCIRCIVISNGTLLYYDIILERKNSTVVKLQSKNQFRSIIRMPSLSLKGLNPDSIFLFLNKKVLAGRRNFYFFETFLFKDSTDSRTLSRCGWVEGRVFCRMSSAFS